MKRLVAAALAVSLALNLALAALFFIGLGTPAEKIAPPASPPTPAVATGPTLDASFWPALQGADAADLRGLVARLRAAGFPPAMLRAIVASRLTESFAARRKALEPDGANQAFWKRAPANPALEAARRQLSREQQKTMRDLLGADADPDDPMSRYFRERRVAGIPAAKLETVREIMRDFDERRDEIYLPGTGVPQANAEKLAALERQQREAIARTLTPQEYEDWQLRSSDTAQDLRGRLALFEPSEEEFRALFALRRDFDERFRRSFGAPTEAELRARGDAQHLLDEQIKSVLGPTRAADYERATDSTYVQASRILYRLQLPAENAAKIYAVQQDTRKQQQALTQDANLTSSDRIDRLARLHAEATAQLLPLLGGERGLAIYRQNSGYWINALEPLRPPRK